MMLHFGISARLLSRAKISKGLTSTVYYFEIDIVDKINEADKLSKTISDTNTTGFPLNIGLNRSK